MSVLTLNELIQFLLMTWQFGVLTPSYQTVQQGENRIQLVLLQSGILGIPQSVILNDRLYSLQRRHHLDLNNIEQNWGCFCVLYGSCTTRYMYRRLIIANCYGKHLPSSFLQNYQFTVEKRRGGEVVPLHTNIIINSVCLSRQELYFAIK